MALRILEWALSPAALEVDRKLARRLQVMARAGADDDAQLQLAYRIYLAGAERAGAILPPLEQDPLVQFAAQLLEAELVRPQDLRRDRDKGGAGGGGAGSGRAAGGAKVPRWRRGRKGRPQW